MSENVMLVAVLQFVTKAGTLKLIGQNRPSCCSRCLQLFFQDTVTKADFEKAYRLIQETLSFWIFFVIYPTKRN